MILSHRGKIDKPVPRSLRPSLFLNEFDFSALTQTTSVKTEGNLSNQKEKQKTEVVNLITEQSQQSVLPLIDQKILTRKKEVNISKEKKERQSQNNIVYITSEQTSPLTKSELKLPTIQQTPQPKLIPRHSRVLTNEDLKKVEFRPSILVIDFINGNIKREQISDSVKPLTKKFTRQQTKFIK